MSLGAWKGRQAREHCMALGERQEEKRGQGASAETSLVSRLLMRVTNETRPHSEPQSKVESGMEGSCAGSCVGQGEQVMAMWAMQAGYMSEE